MKPKLASEEFEESSPQQTNISTGNYIIKAINEIINY